MPKSIATGGDFSATRTQAVMGSPAYMSPEQMRSAKMVDGRTDIWAMGLILYQLVTGRVPWEAETFTELCFKVAMDPLPPLPPTSLQPGFEDVIRCCLEKDPARRFPDVYALAAALAPFAPPHAQPLIGSIGRVLGKQPGGHAPMAGQGPIGHGPATSRGTLHDAAGQRATQTVAGGPKRRGAGIAAALGAVVGVVAIVAVLASRGGAPAQSGPTPIDHAAAQPPAEQPGSPPAAQPAPPPVSLQILDQLGVRLNLADCHERQGRTATAWAEFREAASQADRRGDSRAAFARQRADGLAGKLTKLQISVSAANQLPGLSVRRDGTPVPGEAFGSPLPVDPGSHAIEVSAPGCLTWSTHIDIRKPGDTLTVEVPRLSPAASEPGKPVAIRSPAPREELDSSDARHHRHVLGLAVGAGGVVALGVGVALGLEARSKWHSVGAHCDPNDVCDAQGVSTNHDARLFGNIGTVVGGVGAAAIIAGGVLYLTAPSARATVEHARLELHGDGLQLGYAGAF